jgi:hypothetical protein
MCSAHAAIVARRWAGPARGEGGALSCGGPCSGFHPVHSTRCVPRLASAPRRAERVKSAAPCPEAAEDLVLIESVRVPRGVSVKPSGKE